MASKRPGGAPLKAGISLNCAFGRTTVGPRDGKTLASCTAFCDGRGRAVSVGVVCGGVWCVAWCVMVCRMMLCVCVFVKLCSEETPLHCVVHRAQQLSN